MSRKDSKRISADQKGGKARKSRKTARQDVRGAYAGRLRPNRATRGIKIFSIKEGCKIYYQNNISNKSLDSLFNEDFLRRI